MSIAAKRTKIRALVFVSVRDAGRIAYVMRDDELSDEVRDAMEADLDEVMARILALGEVLAILDSDDDPGATTPADGPVVPVDSLAAAH